MKVSAGSRGTSFSNSRQVTIRVTGMANNDLMRSSDCVMQVPYTRLNETMRLVQRTGGKITEVAVNGGDIPAATAAPKKTKDKSKG